MEVEVSDHKSLREEFEELELEIEQDLQNFIFPSEIEGTELGDPEKNNMMASFKKPDMRPKPEKEPESVLDEKGWRK